MLKICLKQTNQPLNLGSKNKKHRQEGKGINYQNVAAWKKASGELTTELVGAPWKVEFGKIWIVF